MNIYFLHVQNLPFLRYIHCNYGSNLHIIRKDMEENVSVCFFLNTVYVSTLGSGTKVFSQQKTIMIVEQNYAQHIQSVSLSYNILPLNAFAIVHS